MKLFLKLNPNTIKKLLRYIIGVFALLIGVSTVSADGGDGYFHMMDGFGYGGNTGSFGFIFMLFFWGIIISFVVFVIKSFTDKKENETPLETLKRRLANGDISEEEFEKLKKKLS